MTVFLESMLDKVAFHVANQVAVETDVRVANALTLYSLLNERRFEQIVLAHLWLSYGNHMHHIVAVAHAC